MTAVEMQELFNDGNCYACYGLSLDEVLTLAIERRYLLELNSRSETSGAYLLGTVSCLACYGFSLFDMLEIALLQLIVENQ